jgi:hypothetical protein
MPNAIERFSNIAKDYSNFSSVVKCYIIVDDPVDAAETLNTDLAKIHGWLNLILIKQKV